MAVGLTVPAVFRGHLAVILTFGLLNLIPLAGDAAGRHGMLGVSRLFRLSGEANFPTIFSALALAAAALVALRLAQAQGLRPGEGSGWRILSILFAIMALDEAIQLHETLNGVGRLLDTGGAWLNVGVFFYGLVGLALAVALFRFWMDQSRAAKLGILAGGLTYVTASIVLEPFESQLQYAGFSPFHWRMSALFAVEELGEMVAVALFLRAFLVRFAELGGGQLLAVNGARPILAIEIVPESERFDAAEPVAGKAVE